MKIAVILTCFNRKQKTLSCLKSLFEARDNYSPKIDLHIYLTDDGCTDGTVDAIRNTFPNENIRIIQGDGTLFWAKGMIVAWKAAMEESSEWDFYLLLNDDTILLPNAFCELMNAHKYSIEHFGKGGIYSGVICALDDPTKMTYGGDLWVDGKYSKTTRLEPTGEPQLCNMTNANIFMVDESVVDKIGIFYPYEHGCADNDYTIHARKAGIPVLLTGHFCGKCDCDHRSDTEARAYLQTLSFNQRKAYFNSPLHSIKDSLTFVKRNMPARYPYVLCGRLIDLYSPSLYTHIKNKKLDR